MAKFMFIVNSFESLRKVSSFKNKVQIYRVKNLPQINEKHRILAKLAQELEQKYKLTFLTYSPVGGDFLIAVGENLVENVLPHKRYIIEYYREGILENYQEPLRSLIYRLCREKLEQYKLWRQAYNKYFEFIPEKKINMKYEIYRGVFFRVDLFKDKITLTLDPISRIVDGETVTEYISRVGLESAKQFLNLKKTQPARYILVELIRKGSRTKAIKKVLALRNESVSTPLIVINGQTYSVKSYYRDYLKMPKVANAIDDKEPVIEVDEGPRSGFYAPTFSKLILRTDDIPPESRPLLRPEIFLSPEARLKLTQKFLEIITPLDHPEVGKIEFENKPLSFDSSCSGILDRPILSFHKKTELIDYNEYPRFLRNKLKKWGPRIRKAFPPRKCLVIVHPEFISESLAKAFYSDIRKVSKIYFRIRLPERPRLWKYPEVNVESHFRQFRNSIGAILFVVRDEYDSETYYRFKRIFEGIPNQAITYGLINLKWSAKNKRERSLYRNAILNVTAGLLGKMGTRPWLLAKKLSSDLYIGMDVGGLRARMLNITIMDDIGNYKSEMWRALSGLKPSKEDISSFFQYIVDKFQEVKDVTIHKDGELFREEIEGVIERVDELKKRNRTLSVTLVAIKKNVPFRIYYKKDRIATTPLGAFIVLDENTAIIATTGHPILKQGMAKPLLVEIYPISVKANIAEILDDIHRLSFMHWGTLISKMKLPATIKYADDLGSYTEYGIRISPPL